MLAQASLRSAKAGVGVVFVVRVGIAEAALRLGISQDTVRKRLKEGELSGEREKHAGGFQWRVELFDDEPVTKEEPFTFNNGTPHGESNDFGELVATLRAQLEAQNRQIEQLHVIIQQQTQVIALPAPMVNHPWWRFW